MKPYARTNMTHKKNIFNYRFSRSRRYIESTFGILSNKFRVFHTSINASFNVAKNIVKACCVLNNFIRVRDGYSIEDTLTIEAYKIKGCKVSQSKNSFYRSHSDEVSYVSNSSCRITNKVLILDNFTYLLRRKNGNK